MKLVAQNLNCRRIDLGDLKIGRRLVEDTRTGDQYRVYRGEVLDAANLPVTAWYIAAEGPVFLEAVR